MTTATASALGNGEASADSRNWATISHLSAFIGLTGIPALFGPLVVWLLKKDEDPYVAEAAKDALNFNISFLIYGLVAGISIILLVGLILLPAVLVTWFILVIMAAVKTSNGQTYRYPFTMRFVN
jgi:hypothetical protein